MKLHSNLHTHSTFCDGKNTPEEIVREAIEKRLVSIGFSGHSYTPLDESYCMSRQDTLAYIQEINRLKHTYQTQIEVYLGVEQDFYSEIDRGAFDYTIGSVHYLKDETIEEIYAVDETSETFLKGVQRCAGGDVKRFVAQYYQTLVQMAHTLRPDIIGHFDLIRKLNRDHALFDEDAAWYRALALEAAEQIVPFGCIFEINTGGMQRGYTDSPYPSLFILDYLRKLDAPVTLSSDAHTKENIDFHLEEAASLLKQVGFRTAKVMRNNQFVNTLL